METIELKLVPVNKEYIARTYSMVSRLSMWAKDNGYSFSEIGKLYDAQAVLINMFAEWEDESSKDIGR